MKNWKHILHGGIAVVTFTAQQASMIAPAFSQQAVQIITGGAPVSAGNGLPTTVENATPLGSTTMASSSPVTIATDQRVGDPCMFQTKNFTTFSTLSTVAQIVAGASGKKFYVCSLSVIVGSASVFNIIDGTSATCSLNSTADLGSLVATAGMSFPANGGMTFGNGEGTLFGSANASTNLCVSQSTGILAAGSLSYILQ
jgi:hypothetical protein